MKKRIKRIGVLKTSMVVAIILFFVALIFMLPLGFFVGTLGNITGSRFPGFPFIGGFFFLFMPVLYGVMGFIMTVISCLIYNLIAQWTGGIELEFETVDE